MAHSNKIISSILLPGESQAYQIHDAEAIHNIEDLGLAAALVFKGTKATESEIYGLTSAKVGDVWLCTANNTEYICKIAISGTANSNAWEKLGNIHDAASSTHTHTVTVAGSNAASTVTGTVTVPTISTTKKYLTATTTPPTIDTTSDTVLGTGTTFNVSGGGATKTYIKASATGTAVGSNGTTTVLTGLGTPNTDTALGTGATFKVTGGTAVTSNLNTTVIKNPSATKKTVPNVVGNTDVEASKVKTSGSVTGGQLPTWSANVDANGLLTFSWDAGNHVSVTLPTFETVTATKTEMGTSIDTSYVTTQDVTVATGTVSGSGQGSAVATGINSIGVSVNSADTVTAVTGYTPSTATALTGVTVTAQPTIKLETSSTSGTGYVQVATDVNPVSVTASGDNVTALTSASAGAPGITLTESATSSTGSIGYISQADISSTSANIINGQATAQKWTPGSITVSSPQ